MFVALVFVALLVVSGTVATYAYDRSGSLLSRLAFGACTALAAYSLVAFVIVLLLGFGLPALLLALATCLLPLALLAHPSVRSRLTGDLSDLRAFLAEGGLSATAGRLYGLLVVLGMWLIFDRVLFELPSGMYTGYVNNLGDLPLHLQIINSFALGQNYPPEHPVYMGTTFSYPYLADFLSATLVGLGASLREALLIPNLILGVGLVAVVHRWTLELTGSAVAARLAPLIVLLSGGLGFVMLLDDARLTGQGLLGALANLDYDLTIRGDSIYRFGNAVTTLLVTQRGLAFGLPVAVVVFTLLWRQLNDQRRWESSAGELGWRRLLDGRGRLMLAGGLLTATLPLIHAHSYVVVMITAFLFGLLFREWRAGRWRLWLLFVLPAVALAVPQYLLSTVGSSADTSAFIALELGWDRGNHNPLLFWLANTGLFIPLLIGAFLVRRPAPLVPTRLALYFLPFLLWFVVPNVLRLAPWIWDNIRVLFYWWVGAVPIVALLLAHLWSRTARWKTLAVGCLLLLTFAGGVDVWRSVATGTAYREFDPDGMAIAALIRESTPPRAVVLHAPTYNSATFLTGRRSVLGYPGHIWSHGLEYHDRQRQIGQMYAGEPGAGELFDHWTVDFVLIGPLERGMMPVNDDYFANWPVVGEAGEYKLLARP